MEPLEGLSTVEEMLVQRASRMQLPINGSIELTPLCNMSCDMCYVRLDRRDMEKFGHLRSADDWLRLGEQMQQAGVLFMLLTGGEPLLYPEFKEVYLELRKLGMILTINTNGTLIDEEWAAFFKQYPPRRINITMYGADQEAYDTLCHYPQGYERMLRGIRLLKEAGVDVKGAQSVTAANVQDQDKLFALAKELDIPCFCDSYMLPAGKDRKNVYPIEMRLAPEDAARVRLADLKNRMSSEAFAVYVKAALEEVDRASDICEKAQEPGHFSCLAGSCSFTVNWRGELRPCVLLPTPSVSAFDTTFMEAWQSLREQIARIELSAKCHRCHMQSVCRSCGAAAYWETGDFAGTPEYLCRVSEAYIGLLREEEHTETV